MLLRKLLGALLIVLGVLFGFVPFVPGIVLILLGLQLLGMPIIPLERVKGFFRRDQKNPSPDEEI